MTHLISVSPLFFTAKIIGSRIAAGLFCRFAEFRQDPPLYRHEALESNHHRSGWRAATMREGSGAPSLSPMASSADNGDTRTLRQFVNEILKHWRNRGRMRADAADGRASVRWKIDARNLRGVVPKLG